ncbi:hypothetical protein Hanom_Chr12g01106871 [Helianthus anomalus]
MATLRSCGQSVAFWSGQPDKDRRVSDGSVDRTKTSRFGPVNQTR